MVSVIGLSLGLLSCGFTSDEPSAQGSSPESRPEVRYDPSPPEVVTEMLRLAGVASDDVVFDLGCGDGRIVIAAVERTGARGVCVDIDPQRIAESRANAERAGVADRITFRTEDLFETDLTGATVVMLFLSRDVNARLRARLLRELEPGTRIVSHWHDMGDWVPNTAVTVLAGGRPRSIYLWVVPEEQ